MICENKAIMIQCLIYRWRGKRGVFLVQKSVQTDFGRRLAACKPIPWERIPDFGLYMDQVITYIDRQYHELYEESERLFTPAMVNNYVKMGLVSRPVGKKYGRDQLAQLLMICVLKQAASAEGMKRLLTPLPGQTVEALYAHFCEQQSQVFEALAGELPLPSPLTCVVRGAACRLLCNAVLSAPGKEEEA